MPERTRSPEPEARGADPRPPALPNRNGLGVGPSRFLSAFLCGPLGVLGAVLVSRALWLPTLWMDFLGGDRGLRAAFGPEAYGRFGALSYVLAAVGLLFLGVGVAGLVRKGRRALSFLRAAYVLVYLAFLYYAYLVYVTTGVAGEHMARKGIMKRDDIAVMDFYSRWDLLWPYAAAVVLVAVMHVVSWTRNAIFLYTGEWREGPAPGDRILENIRTHGREPGYRKSLLGSAGAHLAVIVIIPILLEMRGCIEPYRVPKGSGSPAIAVMRAIKPKKKKKRKRYVLRADSAIYFHVPDLDDSEVLKQVDEDTQLTYIADPNAVHGKLGAGGGKTGGWPDGMDKGEVRFIRMKYDGSGWDDGMDDKARADANFLDFFRKLVPFPVALKGESHPIRLLAKYPKGFAPPFVYMTGHGSIRCSRSEVKIMRGYLLDGGMLFADCGSSGWSKSFHGFIRSVLPDKTLLVIADDDPIFRMPYAFPNGAPPLWHHGGWRALGMKHKGRWCVFYHPGDVNDAWKTRHSGLRPELARGAFHMGVNIIYYAFTNYLAETRKYRK